MNTIGRVRKVISLKHQEKIKFTKKLRVTKKLMLYNITKKRWIVIKKKQWWNQGMKKKSDFFQLQCKTAPIPIYVIPTKEIRRLT